MCDTNGTYVTPLNMSMVDVSPVSRGGAHGMYETRGGTSSRMPVSYLGHVTVEESADLGATASVLSAPVAPLFMVACIPVSGGQGGVLDVSGGGGMDGVRVVPGSHYLVRSVLSSPEVPGTEVTIENMKHTIHTSNGKGSPPEVVTSHYTCKGKIRGVPGFSDASTPGVQYGLASGHMSYMERCVPDIDVLHAAPVRPEALDANSMGGVSHQSAQFMHAIGVKPTTKAFNSLRVRSVGSVEVEHKNVKELSRITKGIAVESPDLCARACDVMFVSGSTILRLARSDTSLIVIFGVFPVLQYGPLLPIPKGFFVQGNSPRDRIQLTGGPGNSTDGTIPLSMRVGINGIDFKASSIMPTVQAKQTAFSHTGGTSGRELADAFHSMVFSGPVEVSSTCGTRGEDDTRDAFSTKEMQKLLHVAPPRHGMCVSNQGCGKACGSLGVHEMQFRTHGYTVVEDAIPSSVVIEVQAWLASGGSAATAGADATRDGKVDGVLLRALKGIMESRPILEFAGRLCELFSPQPVRQGQCVVSDPFNFPYHIFGHAPKRGVTARSPPPVFLIPAGHLMPTFYARPVDSLRASDLFQLTQTKAAEMVPSARECFSQALAGLKNRSSGYQRNIHFLNMQGEDKHTSRFARTMESRRVIDNTRRSAGKRRRSPTVPERTPPVADPPTRPRTPPVPVPSTPPPTDAAPAPAPAPAPTPAPAPVSAPAPPPSVSSPKPVQQAQVAPKVVTAEPTTQPVPTPTTKTTAKAAKKKKTTKKTKARAMSKQDKAMQAMHTCTKRLLAGLDPSKEMKDPWLLTFKDTFVPAMMDPRGGVDLGTLMFRVLLQAAELMMEGGTKFSSTQQLLNMFLWSTIGMKQADWLDIRNIVVCKKSKTLQEAFNDGVLRSRGMSVFSNMGYFIPLFCAVLRRRTPAMSAFILYSVVLAPLGVPSIEDLVKAAKKNGVPADELREETTDTLLRGYFAQSHGAVPASQAPQRKATEEEKELTRTTRNPFTIAAAAAAVAASSKQSSRRTAAPNTSTEQEDTDMKAVDPGEETGVETGVETGMEQDVEMGGEPEAKKKQGEEEEEEEGEAGAADTATATIPATPPPTKRRRSTTIRAPNAPRKTDRRWRITQLVMPKVSMHGSEPQATPTGYKGYSELMLQLFVYVRNGIRMSHPEWAKANGFEVQQALTPVEYRSFLKHVRPTTPLNLQLADFIRMFTYIVNQMPCIRRPKNVQSKANQSYSGATNHFDFGRTSLLVDVDGKTVARRNAPSAPKDHLAWAVLHPTFFQFIFPACPNTANKDTQVRNKTDKGSVNTWKKARRKFKKTPDTFVDGNTMEHVERVARHASDPTRYGDRIIWPSHLIEFIPLDPTFDFFDRFRDRPVRRHDDRLRKATGTAGAASKPSGKPSGTPSGKPRGKTRGKPRGRGGTRARSRMTQAEREAASLLETSWETWKKCAQYEGTIDQFVAEECAVRGPDNKMYIAVVSKKNFYRIVTPHMSRHVLDVGAADRTTIHTSDGDAVTHLTYPLSACVDTGSGTASSPVIPMSVLRKTHLYATATILRMYPGELQRATLGNINAVSRSIANTDIEAFRIQKEEVYRYDRPSRITQDDIFAFVSDRIEVNGGVDGLQKELLRTLHTLEHPYTSVFTLTADQRLITGAAPLHDDYTTNPFTLSRGYTPAYGSHAMGIASWLPDS